MPVALLPALMATRKGLERKKKGQRKMRRNIYVYKYVYIYLYIDVYGEKHICIQICISLYLYMYIYININFNPHQFIKTQMSIYQSIHTSVHFPTVILLSGFAGGVSQCEVRGEGEEVGFITISERRRGMEENEIKIIEKYRVKTELQIS